MPHTFRRLPDSELAVMQALWDAGRPLTRPEIDAALAASRDWSVSTVVALLGRLADKGFLAHEKHGRGYLYRALVTREEYLAAESQSLLRRLYRGRPANFIAALYDGGALSQEDIDELRACLDAYTHKDG